ncbi:hypothetical protein KKR89_16495 [Cellulomonas dongxiuzhuiae]|uniref:Uncharacterized protein n=1 Tax=Cellulomonas dongxiuzhuiae TaxID=2819979 RepID=A0ABX8GIF6_9CELL|nr:hypothetical protein [Cellulomonas dongxiuzhuiae]QWC15834.1 hypothetical protein KKR89_16495 [Cellulomonas dongxiuzhuiae]
MPHHTDIATISWGLPDDWVDWTHGDLGQAEADVAALEDDPTARAAIMAAVRKFDSIITEGIPGTACAAIWTPGPRYRKPQANALLRLGSPPAAGPMNVETLLDAVRTGARPRWAGRLLEVAAFPSHVTAGDAVLRIVDRAPRLSRRVSREWTWFILPADTGQFVSCQFESSSVEHFDHIAEVATDVANMVEVTLRQG